ncbi:MAG: hypothetical protein ACXW3Z_08855, partial [Limisphaerales bacterium]
TRPPHVTQTNLSASLTQNKATTEMPKPNPNQPTQKLKTEPASLRADRNSAPTLARSNAA